MAIAVLAAAGCARRAPEPAADAYPYAASAPRAFYATAEGLSDSPGAEAPAPAALAHNASVLSADGGRILVAVNGAGPAFVEPAPDGRAAYRVVGAAGADDPQGGGRSAAVGATPASAFSRLTAGGAWPFEGGFLLQLYRDPFNAESGSTGGAGASNGGAVGAGGLPRLFLVGFDARDTVGTVTALDPFPSEAKGAFELFALFPAGGRWYAELRAERADRVELRFFSLAALKTGDPPAEGTENEGKPARTERPREIDRRDFEAALRPRRLADLPAGVATALDEARKAMGARCPGPRIFRVRGADGRDGWYLDGKRPEDAAPAFVWCLPPADRSGAGQAVGADASMGTVTARGTVTAGDGATVLVLLPDGTFAHSGGGQPATVRTLGPPVPGASFTALAAAKGIAAAAWEAGDFPFVRAAGIVVAEAASPSDARRDIVKP